MGAQMSDTLVLCYHALSERFPAALSTTPERFEGQLRRLAQRGYRGVTFSEAATRPRGRTVAVTFDDAYRSVLELGLPLLKQLNWPATLFAPTDYIGAEGSMSWPGIEPWIGGPHEHELLPLSWSQLSSLSAQGWEIGSHTCSHPRLTLVDDQVLRHELEASKASCEEHLAQPCTSIAYPYGDVDARVVRAAEAAGYRAAAALPSRLHGPRALEWPRVGIWHGDGDRRFALKVSPTVRRARRLMSAVR